MEWEKFWAEYPTKFEETDFFRQVGKTVSGKPVSPIQFEGRISDIQTSLIVNKDDLILDMCCGNGLITKEIAKNCKFIVGIDYSEPLIKIAKKYNQLENVAYYHGSVLDQKLKVFFERPFTKIYMYEALQHFTKNDLPKILDIAKQISGPGALFFLGGIPDVNRIWDFYDTEERREDYLNRKSRDQEAIGTWWEPKYIEDLCIQSGFEASILQQNKLLDSAHYRFDVRLTNK